MIFQSTLPAWGATWCGSTGKSSAVFQSTLPVWGATGYPVLLFFQFEFQSTLPVWGATWRICGKPCAGSYFNPPTPWGARHLETEAHLTHTQLQSPHPVWGATAYNMSNATAYQISIHTPRVGSDHGDQIADTEYDISIHAPRVGSDTA